MVLPQSVNVAPALLSRLSHQLTAIQVGERDGLGKFSL